MTWNRISKYIDSDPQLKLIFIHSIKGGTLFYSLNIQPLPGTQIAKLQSFYAGCIRRVTQKRYSKLEQKPIRNYEIREQYNIPTVGSKLKYYRYIQYASCETPRSIAYLNKKDYINEKLTLLNNEIEELKKSMLQCANMGSDTNDFKSDRPL